MSTLTKRQKTQTLNAVKKAYKAWITADDQPILMDDFYEDGTTAVVWEGGPYEWAFLTDGGIEEEFGFEMKAVKVPAGVYTEPIFSYALGLYPA